MFDSKIRLPADLEARAREQAKRLGYSSFEEYLVHLIELNLADLTPEEDETVVNRLKGLGYL